MWYKQPNSCGQRCSARARGYIATSLRRRGRRSRFTSYRALSVVLRHVSKIVEVCGVSVTIYSVKFRR
jgi:hypothetical protein